MDEYIADSVRGNMKSMRLFFNATIIILPISLLPIILAIFILGRWKFFEAWQPEFFFFLVKHGVFASHALLLSAIAAFLIFVWSAFRLNKVSNNIEAMRDSEVTTAILEEYSRSNSLIQLWLEWIFPDLRDEL